MRGTKDPGELRSEIERFAGRFLDRLTEATEHLQLSTRPEVRLEGLRILLRSATAVLEIAAGPVPGVAVLDLVVFLRLARDTLAEHWVPRLFGEEGRPLAEAFAAGEAEVSAALETTLAPGQRQALDTLVQRWRETHPDQVRIEGVRLADFAEDAVRGKEARGLVSSMKSLASVANDAMAMGERVLFLSHRVPSLLRLQARLGAMEILLDTKRALQSAVPHPAARGPARRLAGVSASALGLLSKGLAAAASR